MTGKRKNMRPWDRFSLHVGGDLNKVGEIVGIVRVEPGPF
jgi:hypothetical protein